jgi:hypothetical protein
MISEDFCWREAFMAEQLQALDWAISDRWNAMASQRVDIERMAASKTANRSTQALLQRPDLGTRLPGFAEFP